MVRNVAPGGVVERDHCKFFLSSVFSLWEHDVRKPIADLFGVPPYAITCELMGDIRIVRNDFEHNDGRIPRKEVQNARHFCESFGVLKR